MNSSVNLTHTKERYKMQEIVESIGYHCFVRIGRPALWYDNRTNFNTNIKEFERSNSERRRVLGGLPVKYDVVSHTSDVEIEFPSVFTEGEVQCGL